MFGMQVIFNLQKEVSLPFPLFIVIGIIYIILGVVCFFPSLYLYKFSNNAGNLVNFRNQNRVDETFNYLAKFYKFVGIFVIITLALYLVALPFIIFFNMSSQLFQ